MTLSVLMIGNSFSICVGKNLPQMVATTPECHLTLGSLYIGGCPLERHVMNLREDEASEPGKAKYPYRFTVWESGEKKPVREGKGNLLQGLAYKKWDIVTIQQASPLSWQAESYQPWAEELIAAIRKYAPQAEIIIQQTWAYRSSDPRITELGEPIWGFHQDEMHNQIVAAYRSLAEKYGFRVIPTGDAVRLARLNDTHRFKESTAEALAALRWPDLPPQASDPVGKYFWRKEEDGSLRLSADHIHLNERGQYLQAAVWFEFLFGRPATALSYESPTVSKEDCVFLRQMAHRAVQEYQQVKKQ